MFSKLKVPKLGNNLDTSIYSKLVLLDNIGSKIAAKQTKHAIYYRNTGGLYWKIFTDYSPKFKKNGEVSVSSRETKLFFNSDNDLKISLALFWSNLYWWWYSTNSNGRDNNPFDLKSFPINDEIYKNIDLLHLSDKLINSLTDNSTIANRNHGKDVTEYQKFNPKKSKEIVDEIDKTLYKYYNLTLEELDYIKNYDIKYRLGEDIDIEEEE